MRRALGALFMGVMLAGCVDLAPLLEHAAVPSPRPPPPGPDCDRVAQPAEHYFQLYSDAPLPRRMPGEAFEFRVGARLRPYDHVAHGVETLETVPSDLGALDRRIEWGVGVGADRISIVGPRDRATAVFRVEGPGTFEILFQLSCFSWTSGDYYSEVVDAGGSADFAVNWESEYIVAPPREDEGRSLVARFPVNEHAMWSYVALSPGMSASARDVLRLEDPTGFAVNLTGFSQDQAGWEPSVPGLWTLYWTGGSEVTPADATLEVHVHYCATFRCEERTIE